MQLTLEQLCKERDDLPARGILKARLLTVRAGALADDYSQGVCWEREPGQGMVGPRSPSSIAPQCTQQHGHPWRGQHSVHVLRDSHRCLDACLELSHTALNLTALTALLLLFPPYTSLMLCPSETIPATWYPRPLRGLAAEDVLVGTGHIWRWVKDVVSTQTTPCPGMAWLRFRRDIGEGAFCTGLAGR